MEVPVEVEIVVDVGSTARLCDVIWLTKRGGNLKTRTPLRPTARIAEGLPSG
jgi:hypothetical protein